MAAGVFALGCGWSLTWLPRIEQGEHGRHREFLVCGFTARWDSASTPNAALVRNDVKPAFLRVPLRPSYSMRLGLARGQPGLWDKKKRGINPRFETTSN